ncbi:UNVERIFIED_CONTAM: hypothetical protein Sradi_2914400 [Sesamum radiatum]|uniref:Uncharacterized protein n=1 Tax=Sesamum radiatum TaxID=300843 RepID=A0AAW2S0E5_SESRA
MPSQPRRILIPGQGLGCKNLSYNVLKKQMKTGVWISKKVYVVGNDVSVQSMRDEIVGIEGTSAARRSNNAIPKFSQETCIPSHNIYPAAASVILSSKCTSRYSMVYLQAILYASLLQNIASIKYLLKALLMNESKGRERVSGKLEDVSAGPLGEKKISKLHNATIADTKWNWKLIDRCDFYTVDVYSIENFYQHRHSAGMEGSLSTLCLPCKEV